MPKLVVGKIDENGLPSLKEDTFEPPTGYRASAPIEQQVFTTPAADGRTAKVEWSDQVLNVSTKGQPAVQLVGKDEAGFEQLKEWAKEDAADPNENSTLEYEGQNFVTGVGHAGKMMSVASGYYEDAGGAHPDHGTMYQTYDVRSGKQVHLDDVLSPAQFKSVVEQVQQKLPSINSEWTDTFEPINAASPGDAPRYEDWANQVRDNFALVTDKDGRQYIRIGWESGMTVLGDMAARFTFTAPTDAAFEQKIGAK